MDERDYEERLLRSVATQNAQSILLARQRAEEELLRAKEALEAKTAQLAHSLSMMHATLESTTDGILVTDERRRVTDFKEKYVEMWRMPRDVMDSRDHRQLMNVASRCFRDPSRYLARMDSIYAMSPPESFDLLVLIDGRVLERFSKIQFLDGLNVGRVWSFRDITDRKRTEEALRDETRILELLNKTGIALAGKLDLQTLVQSVTDAATELSGAKFGAFFYNTTGQSGDAFTLYTLSGAAREAFEQFGQPRATPLFGPTFTGEGPIRCEDVLKDSRYGKMEPQRGMPRGHLAVRSYLAVPVVSRTSSLQPSRPCRCGVVNMPSDGSKRFGVRVTHSCFSPPP